MFSFATYQLLSAFWELVEPREAGLASPATTVRTAGITFLQRFLPLLQEAATTPTVLTLLFTPLFPESSSL